MEAAPAEMIRLKIKRRPTTEGSGSFTCKQYNEEAERLIQFKMSYSADLAI